LEEGSSATPLTTQDLFCGTAISIPAAPTKFVAVFKVIGKSPIIREFANDQFVCFSCGAQHGFFQPSVLRNPRTDYVKISGGEK
jgi:hypothetical protein